MAATEPQTDSNVEPSETPGLIRKIRLRDGLERVRTSLKARGEPISPDESHPVKEMEHYFNEVLFRLSCAASSLQASGTLPKADIMILEEDVELTKEIGRLFFLVFGD
ncbi:MAG TPA: hypothetical protein VIB39_15300 [Candidatus Angelobacter sp.]|jgi:hypothetical protein